MNLFRYRRRSKKHSGAEIYPDEIFLDASNLPQFDTNQFEGRIERPIAKASIRWVALVLLLAGLSLGGKLWSLQVVEGEALAYQSEQNRLEHDILFADRGVIYDRTGVELAQNAPNETESFAVRRYTDMPGFAHVLGYVSYPKKDSSGIFYQEEFIGQAGIEESLDPLLQGQNGLRLVEVDALSRLQSESTIEPPQNGENVVLSIDAGVQAALFKAISETAEEQGFIGGAAVIMDVESGELLALSSYPEYDSNVLAAGTPASAIQEFVTDSRTPFLDRPISGLYTPGSIVKPFLAVAALEEGIITPEKEIESTGRLVIPNPYFPDRPSVFRDWRAHGFTDMREALAVSSDVYFYQIGGGYEDQDGLGIERIERYLRLFGFGAPTGVELGGEAAGTIPSPSWKAAHFDGEEWLLGNTYHTSIGQYGFQVTPLQVVRATAALANGGILLTPTLRTDAAPLYDELSLQDANLQVAREGMGLAVKEGTAAALNFPSVSIAAKTGTAEVGAQKEFINSWVVGFFPADEPKYAFVVLMERGKAGTLTGAPAVAREVFSWMVEQTPQYLGLPEKDAVDF